MKRHLFMKRETVQCKGCGYLAVIEPEAGDSKEVLLYRRRSDYHMTAYHHIRCHLEKADLGKELVDQVFGDKWVREINRYLNVLFLKKEMWQSVINKQRQCDGFTPYMQGLSPDKHRLEARRQVEKRKDRRRTFKDGVFLSILTAVLITVGAVLVKVFWD